MIVKSKDDRKMYDVATFCIDVIHSDMSMTISEAVGLARSYGFDEGACDLIRKELSSKTTQNLFMDTVNSVKKCLCKYGIISDADTDEYFVHDVICNSVDICLNYLDRRFDVYKKLGGQED